MSSTNQKAARDLQRAIALHTVGKVDEAEDLYRRVVERAPRNAPALYFLGEIEFARGDVQKAEQFARRACAADKDFAPAQVLMGNVANTLGDLGAAVNAWRAAVAIEPGNAAANVNLALALPGRGEPIEAETRARRAIAAEPASFRAQYALGCALVAQGRLTDAERPLLRALEHAGDNTVILREIAALLIQMKRFSEASAYVSRALLLAPDEAATHNVLGTLLANQNDHAAAETAYRDALRLGGSAPSLLSELGMTLRVLGRFDEAIACFEQALSLDPSFAEAHRGLAETNRNPSGDAGMEKLHTIVLDPQSSIRQKIDAHYALGRAMDELARYGDALKHFEHAGQLQQGLLAADGKNCDSDSFETEVDAVLARAPQHRPVTGFSTRLAFIVGMPRSGSTLIDQIASSHPSIQSLGEAPDIPLLAGVLYSAASDPVALAEADMTAARYAQRADALSGGAALVIDKQLDNAFHLGTIATYFPDARIIHCCRDFRDMGLSCLMQSFTGPNGEYTSFDAIRRRALTLARAMDRWRSLLPLPMLEVHYEDVVQDLEGQARRIIDFLGLPWDDACLNFHTTERAVTTASAWQVRQPIYTGSVGRWKRYADFLPSDWTDGSVS